MAAPPEEEIPAPPLLSARLAAGRAEFSWTAPTEATSYSLHLQQLRPSVLAPRTFTGLSSGDGLFSTVEPSVGFYSVWLSDRGVAGPRTFFSVSAPKPPAVAVAVTELSTTYSWDAPAVFAMYMLTVENSRSGVVVFAVEVSSSAGSYLTATPPPGGYRVFLEDRGVEGDKTAFTVSRPPSPPTVSVALSGGMVTYTWTPPGELVDYTLEVFDVNGQHVVFAIEELDSEAGTFTTTAPPAGSYRVSLLRFVPNVGLLLGDATAFTVAPPPKPPSLSVAVAAGKATYSWTAPAAATTYQLEVGVVDGGTLLYTGLDSGDGSFVADTPDPGSYTARLRDGAVLGDATAFTVAPPPETPTPPAVAASVSGVQTTYSWTAPTADTTYTLHVQRIRPQLGAEGRYTGLASQAGSYIAATPSVGVYNVWLSDMGVKGPVGSFTVSPPSAPAKPPTLSADVAGTLAELSWTAPSAAALYTLMVRSTSDSSVSVTRMNIPSGNSPARVYLEPDHRYEAFLQHNTASGDSTFFDVISAPPVLDAEVDGSSVEFTWDAPTVSRSYTLIVRLVADRTVNVTVGNVSGSAGRASVTVPQSGRYEAYLQDGSVIGQFEFFEVAEAPPVVNDDGIPNLSVEVLRFDAYFRWAAPSSADTYTLQLTEPDGSVFGDLASGVDSGLGSYVYRLRRAGVYMARLVGSDGTNGDAVTFTAATVIPFNRPRVGIPDRPIAVEDLDVFVEGSTARMHWSVPNFVTTYTIEMVGPGETEYSTIAEGVYSWSGVYTATGLADGAYRARLREGTLAGRATSFSVGVTPPALRSTVTGRNVAFLWSPPSTETVYSLELTEPGGSTFTAIRTGVNSRSGVALLTLSVVGVYQARLTAGGRSGAATQFVLGGLVPPRLRSLALGHNINLSWEVPEEERRYGLQVTEADKSTFRTVQTGINSSSGSVLLTETVAGRYMARLIDGAQIGGATEFFVDRLPPKPTFGGLREVTVTFTWPPPTNHPESDYDVELAETGVTAFTKVASQTTDINRFVYTIDTAGSYSVRLTRFGLTGPPAMFTVPVQSVPPDITATVNKREVTFRWLRFAGRTLSLFLQMTEPGGSTFTRNGDTVGDTSTRRGNLANGTYMARLENAGTVGSAVTFTISGQPATPEVVSSVSGRVVRLSWTQPAGSSDRYTLQVKRPGGSEFAETSRHANGSGLRTVVGSSGSSGSQYLALHVGEYMARLVGPEGAGAVESFVIARQTRIPTPPQPTAAYNLTGHRDSFWVRWTAPSTPTLYSVEMTDVDGRTFSAAPQLFGSGGSLSSLEEYTVGPIVLQKGTYMMRLVDRGVAGPAGNVTVTEPTFLDGLSAAYDDEEVTFSWDAAGRRLYDWEITSPDNPRFSRRPSPSFGSRADDLFVEDDESFTLDGVAAGRYELRLKRGSLTSPPFAFRTPDIPPEPSASVDRRTVTLRWSPPALAVTYSAAVTTEAGEVFARTVSSAAGSVSIAGLPVGDHTATLTDRGKTGPAVGFSVVEPPELSARVTGGRLALLRWEPPEPATTYSVLLTGGDGLVLSSVADNIPSSRGAHVVSVEPGGVYRAQLSAGALLNGPVLGFQSPPALRISQRNESGRGVETIVFSWDWPPTPQLYTVEVTSPDDSSFRTAEVERARPIFQRGITFPGGSAHLNVPLGGRYRARIISSQYGTGPYLQFTTPPAPVAPPSLSVSTSGWLATFTWTPPDTDTSYTLAVTSSDDSTVNVSSAALDSRRGRHSVLLPKAGRYQARLSDGGQTGARVRFTMLPDLTSLIVFRSATIYWDNPTTAQDTYNVQVTSQGTFLYSTVATGVDSEDELYNFSLPSAGVFHARLADDTGFGPSIRIPILM